MSRTTASRIAYLLLAVILTLGVAALGGLSVLRKIEAFQPLGFAALREGGGLRVIEPPEASTGLLVGDQILSIDNEAVGPLDGVRERLIAEPSVELLIKRGERLQRILYRRPGLDVDARYLVLAVSGIVYLLIGFFTLYKQRQRQGLLFFLWCLASAAVYLFTPLPPYDRLDRVLFVGDELARLVLPPLFLHLFLVFPTPLARPSRLLRLIPFAYLPAAVLAFFQADLMLTGGALVLGAPSESVLRALDRAGVYQIVLYVLLALAVLGWRLRQAGDVDERRQLRWISIGLGSGYLPFLGLYALPWALRFQPSELLTTLAVVPLAIVPLAFAYAILRYKLWDIELIVRNTLSATLTLLLGVLGFALVNLMINRGVPEQLAQVRTLLSFVSGLTIAGLLVPARRGIGSSLERLQYRGTFRKRRALTDLGRELLHERDLDPLCAGLLDHLQEAIELERVNLYLIHQDALVALRPEPQLPAQMSPEVLSPEGWEDEVVRLTGIEAPTPRLPPALRLYLAGYRYAFPLLVRGARVGLVLTGHKLDRVPLSSEDVELVRQLLNQAALAIENARLVDQLHQRLAEVLRLKQHNEGIIESSPAGLAVLAADDRIDSANLAFAALVGVERRSLVGRPVAEVLSVSLPAPGEGLLEVSFHSPEGGDRYLQLSVAQLGEARQRILMVQDVSERVAIENELKEKDRLASLGMLAAGVAHEVNTPITGISSYAQMLLEDTPEGDPRRELLEKMERQTFRAARIVGSLLEFARNRRTEYRPVALAAVLDEVLAEVAERLADKGIRLVREAAAEESLEVLGSETELAQVFTNLVHNAIDAMEEGGTLGVELEAGEGRVYAAVEDSGVGIAPEQLEKIFQPFYSTKLAAGGTGLGLSISYEIVRRHGGEVRVISTPGQGSRFIVELPRHSPAREAAG